MSRARDLFERLKTEGVGGISALIEDRASEELFLDFKKFGDDGGGRRLHESDNKNLSKAISGFGNGAGGIIVWGVECAPGHDGADLASAKRPLHDAQAFRSRLESVISRLTMPPHNGVENFTIVDTTNAPRGFVITLIPQSSHAPLRAEASDLRNYYIRAGSSFEVMHRDALAGLFGRLPLAKLALQFVSYQARRPRHQQDQRTVLAFGLAIRNVGRVLAEKVYLSMWWGGVHQMVVDVHQKRDAFPIRKSGFPGIQSVAVDGVLLAPDAVEDILDCVIKLPDASQNDLSIRVAVGARNAEPTVIWLRATAGALGRAVVRSAQEEFHTSEIILMSPSQLD